jgi:hypothetical protein
MLKSSREWMTAAGELIVIIGVVLAAVQYVFGISLFYNATDNLESAYRSDVVPITILGDDFVQTNLTALKKNDKAKFEILSRAFVDDKDIKSKLGRAVETLEQIIKCQHSWICNIDNYDAYKPAIRGIWYNFRPSIEELRGPAELANFGKRLETEAKRILLADRANGLTPQPN